MCATQIEIGNRDHLQPAAGGEVLEVPPVRRDEQMRAEEARLLAAKSPRDVDLFGLNFLQVNSVRQKNCEPRFWADCFWMSFVNLDLHVARLRVHLGKPPLSQKHAPRIEPGGDIISVD